MVRRQYGGTSSVGRKKTKKQEKKRKKNVTEPAKWNLDIKHINSVEGSAKNTGGPLEKWVLTNFKEESHFYNHSENSSNWALYRKWPGILNMWTLLVIFTWVMCSGPHPNNSRTHVLLTFTLTNLQDRPQASHEAEISKLIFKFMSI